MISRWPLPGFLSNYKKYSDDSYSIYIAIFSSFLQVVYPVGVTDLRPYFTQIICHNSVNVHRISTKRGTEIRLNEPFKCAEFQPDPSTHSCFISNFAKCAKRSRSKKNEEKKPKLWPLVSRKCWSDFLQIWYVDSPTSPAFL